MEENILQLLKQEATIGFLVAALIFFITLIQVSRGKIGFWITLLLLSFSLASGWLIANHTAIQLWMKQDSQDERNFQEKLLEAFDQLKEDWENFKK